MKKKKKKKAPFGRKFPRWKTAVLLGSVKKISAKVGDSVVDFSWKKPPMLLSALNKKELLILCEVGAKKTVSESNDKAEELFRDWSDFEAQTAQKVTVKEPVLFKLGRATSLIYDSDKWTGQKRSYIHEFTSAPIVWVDSKKSPRVVLLTGGKLRIKREGITG